MPSKSLRATIPLVAETLDAAIADLREQFLRATKTRARAVRQPTDFNVADLCRGLIDDWRSGKVAYGRGEITLSFSGGELAQDADLVIYKPEVGDRFLYSRRPAPEGTLPPQQLDLQGLTAEPHPANGSLTDYLVQTLEATLEAMAELTAHQRAVEARLEQLLSHQARLEQTLQTAIAQNVANQINATALHFNQRLDEAMKRLEQLSTQMAQWPLPDENPDEVPPRNEGEWTQRIKAYWGTVGDYEQYSDSYRAANAATPLYPTPDWIALCELDWARKLSPALAHLYQLIYDIDGIGYEGANILHQFGRHVDPQTGDRYYIYKRSGFTAYDALWQIVRNPQHSWLPELRRISARVAKHYADIFQMFGWEAEAIASLDSILERAYREQQSAYDPRGQQAKSASTLRDHLAVLNLGPFSTLTLETVKRAYRVAMKTAHPDTGGSNEQAQRVNEAYDAILQHYFPNAKSSSSL